MKILRDTYFKRGDIIINLAKTQPRLILSVTDKGTYEYMELADYHFDDIFGNRYYVKKGDISTQPADIVEKYWCLYEIK